MNFLKTRNGPNPIGHAAVVLGIGNWKLGIRNSEDGFITLMATLVVTAAGVAIAVSVLLLGVGSSRTAFTQEQSAQARAAANACAEYGINQLRLANTYDPGSDSNLPLTLGSGTCTLTVTGSGETGRGVRATGTVGDVIRRVQVTGLDVSSAPTITQWQEVDSF